jgi:spore coat protein H
MSGLKHWIVQLALLGGVAACDEQRASTGTVTPPNTDAGSTTGAVASDGAATGVTVGPGDGSTTGGEPAADAATAFHADAQVLFDFPHVPTFDLELPEAEWLALQANAQDEQYVEADCSFEGIAVGKVGLRFKGYYGSLFGCFNELGELVCPRLSLKVKFDEYVADQRFYGLKRLNFNAYRHDDSRMKEKLTYELYRAMGIVAPRATWAVVRVNGESQGLYGMVEQVDGRFADDRWPDAPDGNLYKEVWPTETDPSALIAALATNEEAADVSAFLAFSQAMTTSTEEEARATLGGMMDLDYLARYMAVDDAVANYDGVTYFWTDGITRDNHNFYIYEESPTRFTLIPWDVEASFWINPDHAAPHWTELQQDCSLTYPYWEGLAGAPACDLIFRALNQDLTAWRSASRELLDGPFALDTMLANIDRHVAFIGDAARADPTPNMYATFDQAVQNLRTTLPDLRARLEGLIAE